MSKPLTVTLDNAALEALDDLARRTGRSRDMLVASAIDAYVTQDDWQLGKIEAGLDAADRGDFADDEEIERVKTKFSTSA